MTLEIRQCCNSCGNIRVFNPTPETKRFVEVKKLAATDGWVQVEENKHLCPHCVKRVTHQKVK